MRNPFKNEKISPWATSIITFLVMILIILIMGWQYHRMEKEEISLLKAKIEESAARETLKDFMNARITKNKSQATIFLTEGAWEQVSRRESELIDDFQSFEILEVTQLEKNKSAPYHPAESGTGAGFKFLVEIQIQDGTEIIELIKVIKILDRYYIDSIQLPG